METYYYEDGQVRSTAKKYVAGVLEGYKHSSDGRFGSVSLVCF